MFFVNAKFFKKVWVVFGIFYYNPVHDKEKSVSEEYLFCAELYM